MMGSGGSVSSSRSLEKTPTWAVALICLCFIAISFLIERAISSLGNWLRKNRKKALNEALEKIKSELMLLGFLSLLLTVAQSPISHICVPSTIADKMLPCHKIGSNSNEIRRLSEHLINRRLLWRSNHSYEDGSKEANYTLREQKPPDSMPGLDPCSARGMVPLISQEAITQLHIFIFMLAVMHVTYTILHPALWLLLVVFLLLNVHGLYLYFWISFVPLVIVLAVGAKLQMVVARMALRLKDETSVIMGIPLVQPTNELFWFGRPKLNAFELTFFIWITLEFGLKSCYHEKFQIIIARVVIAVIVQFVCSYVTLPLYALVTQMGSHYKESMFTELTVSALRRWHMDVKQKLKQNLSTAPGSLLSTLTSGRNTPRTGAPPSPLSVSTHML